MKYSVSQYLLLGVSSLILVGILTPIMRILAIRIQAFDSPDMSRKIQKTPVPYLGGVAIAIGVISLTYTAVLYENFSSHEVVLTSYVLIPAFAIAVMGLVDDLRGLQPWPRLIAQTVMGGVVAVILISTDTLGVAFDNRFLNIFFTMLWIVGVCNSINFFDNLDGGAAGTVAIITLFIFFIAYDRQQILISALAIVTAGATSGFLIWNKSPAKIYMGDAGALFLGTIVAVLTIRLNPGLDSQNKSFAIPLALMAIPILDTTVAVTSRIARGISPFQGGRDHLSHRLMRNGLHRRAAAVTLWALATIFSTLALAIYTWPDSLGYPLIAAGALSWVALLIFFLKVPSEDVVALER